MSIARRIGLAAVGLVACGTTPLHLPVLDDVERVHGSAAAREGADLAPETFARAELERGWAQRSHAAGDDVGATIHAERALAAYGHALAVARFTRAGTELADAQKSLEDATVQSQSLDASRAKLDQEAADLERRLQVERERLLPAASGAATAERDAARLVAARSLAAAARLLCDAAHLVGPNDSAVTDAAGALDKVDQQLAQLPGKPTRETRGTGAIVDDAARARTGCLEALTRVRRSTVGQGGDGRADGLLAELSASGAWEPSRDERGVVVTLRGAFRGVKLTDEATSKLKELGRVAAAHPDFVIQAVVHDARAPLPRDDGGPRRAEAAVQVLVAGGADRSKIQGEAMGARLPVVDSTDQKLAARNERLEVVFVPSSD